ncbi:ABC transporter permease [Parvibaculaceae bacterium PLY_AMNH_Bact1]|nr:ABC transporter permease [Parvibaculaceae bacterium PLY_AMNH_Bact1]
MLAQTKAITTMNLRNIVQRPGTSIVVVVGIAGVVAVLVGLLAMAKGFNAALTTTAAPDRAIVLGHGSRNEMNSWLTNEELNIMSQLEGLEMTSGEMYAVVDLTQRTSGEQAYVVGRGITPAAYTVRPELTLASGRFPQAGRAELLVGATAAREYLGLAVGDDVKLRDSIWRVVGHFDTGGTANDSEIWMDLSLAKSVFRRNGVSTMRVRLSDTNDMAAIQDRIARDPRLNISLVREDEFYASQAEARTSLIETFTYFIASIMAVGAIIAALNSMYVAVESRKVEIATLRALGFGQAPIISSVMAEALFLSAIGGVAGATLVYFAMNGYTTSTLNGASNTQIAFSFMVSPRLISLGLSCALMLGLIGGLAPAIHAARAPITTALLGK